MADENFTNDIVRGLLRRASELDIVRVQDVELSGADDPTMLDWAARTGRILLTHGVKTITQYIYERARVGLPMPGVFEVSRAVSIALNIYYLAALIPFDRCAQPVGHWRPLRSSLMISRARRKSPNTHC